MSFSSTFIQRTVATTLLTLGIALLGALAFLLLPVSPLPQVDIPTISVSARMPGAAPETMASTVATPLERALGRIAGVTEMTSSSSLGQTRVTLQFELSRDINGAARDVQAAINASRNMLPTGMPSNPTYRKVNPASAPIMILALTSKTLTQGQIYDSASSVLAQKISQIDGVGDVTVGGSSMPAVRVELNPLQLSKYAISLESVRGKLAAANANRPKGMLEHGRTHWQILASDQAKTAKEYLPLIVSYKNGHAIRLSDVARVDDSVEDVRNAGSFNGEPSVLLILRSQPGANIIETIDRVRKELPNLSTQIPAAIKVDIAMDRTPTIRASLSEVERTLLISIVLVILVVFLFLRSGRATLIPAVAVPVSLIATFAVMYLCGFSLNNLSLMALTIATGFVVDDAIVVLENISRHIEDGMKPFAAAMLGAKEVGFTVLSMSLSLTAVFIPVLLMGGIIGRLFREFAITLSVAILVSLLISLTTTPMMCSRLLRAQKPKHGKLYQLSENFFNLLQSGYRRSLNWVLLHRPLTMLILLVTICLNVYLYVVIPKGFFPQQDTGRIVGGIQADQSISFQAMRLKMAEFIQVVKSDSAVANVVAYTGGRKSNSGFLFATLKPLKERDASADEVIKRLRGKLSKVPGARLFLQSAQDIRVGGRSSNAQYQYTLQADDLQQLRLWTPKIQKALANISILKDINDDKEDKGLQTSLNINRDALARLGLTIKQVDAVLNDAFGQRQVSTIFQPLNQYHVVMEAAPEYWQSPEALKNIYLISASGAQIPLSAVASYAPTFTPLSINHQGEFVATTISFNLDPGTSLSDAQSAINDAMSRLSVPTSVHGKFAGSASVFQQSQKTLPLLILAAILTVYIVLGILYESYIHPLTILSTLPSAGVGALLALMLFKTEFSLIALIGVLLLIGIVKKNAIMMIDFALDAERNQGMNSRDAIFHACMLRFRPIMMTTMAAILGAIPLALGHGDGAELRQPLGISIVGGLIFSQMLTLYTTPVVYLYLDRLRICWLRRREKHHLVDTSSPRF